MNPLIETAYDWHGGQWSPLYSFVSTGGIVHTEDHREGLEAEIHVCINWCKEQGETIYPEQNPQEEIVSLQALHDHVERAELGVPLPA